MSTLSQQAREALTDDVLREAYLTAATGQRLNLAAMRSILLAALEPLLRQTPCPSYIRALCYHEKDLCSHCMLREPQGDGTGVR